MKKIFFLLTFFISSVASAQTTTIDTRLCQYLPHHVPSADTTFQAGVDVNGAFVAPADLPGNNNLQLPEEIEINITPDLAKLLHIPSTTRYVPEASLGVLKMHKDGSLTYNDQPLSSGASQNLVAYCQGQGNQNAAQTNSPPQYKKDLLKNR